MWLELALLLLVLLIYFVYKDCSKIRPEIPLKVTFLLNKVKFEQPLQEKTSDKFAKYARQIKQTPVFMVSKEIFNNIDDHSTIYYKHLESRKLKTTYYSILLNGRPDLLSFLQEGEGGAEQVQAAAGSPAGARD